MALLVGMKGFTSGTAVACNCSVVVKLNVRGMRPLAEQLYNIFIRIKLYANRQHRISVCTMAVA